MYAAALQGDLEEVQCITTRGHLCLEHYYNQHNQNTIIVLPGDLLFAFQSPHHEHITKDTLILRTLPSLNALLRQLGPAIKPDEIVTAFVFIGSCLSDWGLDDEVPWVRGINIVHAGCMKIVNLFDDVTQPLPALPKTLPRHAYLWLRPCRLDPETGCVVPYNGRAVEGGMQHRFAEAAAAAAKATVPHGVADPAEDPDALRVHDLFEADPEDEHSMLAQLEDWAAPDELQIDEGPGEEKKQPRAQAQAQVQPQTRAQAQAQAQQPPPPPAEDPRKHEYFWQWVPVCSTHPDLQSRARSACLRSDARGQNWLLEYPFLVYVGHMIEWPTRTKPRRLDSDIMQYAIYGPLETRSRMHYDHTMCEERHTLQSIHIDTQLL